MKKRFIGVVFILLIAVLFCGVTACTGNTQTGDDDTNISDTETTKEYYVAIYNDTEYSFLKYKENFQITLTAKLVGNKKFVCWLCEGVPYSYESVATYTVKGEAVLKAVYVEDKSFTLTAGEGTLSTETATVIFDSTTQLNQADKLYVGYNFILPIPQYEHYSFEGWYADEDKKITDGTGKSMVPYDGTATAFYAVYKENAFVNIVTVNGVTEVETTRKWYINEGDFIVTAAAIVDKECTGWSDGQNLVSQTSELIVKAGQMENGKTYTFTSEYREAYKLMVISGFGSGAYAKTDEVYLECPVTAGKAFLNWSVKKDDTSYVLGFYTKDERDFLCFINGDLDAEDETEISVTYYGSDENLVTETVSTQDVRKCASKCKFFMGDLEKLGIEIVGKETSISANFETKMFSIIFRLDCMVEGTFVLEDSDITAFEEMGFIISEENVFVYTATAAFNSIVTLVSLPTIKHYKFGNWQMANGESIPTYMPQHDIELAGTFIAEKLTVELKCDQQKGSVKIGQSGDIKSGSYSYNSVIYFYVTANVGYKADKWINTNNLTVQLEQISKEESEIITYVYKYKVTEKQSLTMNFTQRDYKITYHLSVSYDGMDVTNDSAYFTTYTEGYNEYSQTYDYQQINCSIDDQPTADSIGLIYADNWTLSNWEVIGTTINNLKSFTMPHNDFDVFATYTIKKYRVKFSKGGGVNSYSLESINEKAASGYLIEGTQAEYSVPYGAKLDLTVVYENGYSIGDVKGDNTTLTLQNSSYACETDSEREYTYNLSFKMLIAKNSGVSYDFYSQENIHTFEYYVSVDYDNVSPDLDIYNYINLNKNKTKTVDGKTYYFLVSTNENDGERFCTQSDYNYNDEIKTISLTQSKLDDNKYVFSNWTKMYNDGVYGGNRMPDGDMWAYGDFNIKNYKFEIGTAKFAFDGNPDNNVATLDVAEFSQDGNVTEFVDGENYHYYSALTVNAITPTGYDFVCWQAKTTVAGVVTTTTLTKKGNFGEINTEGGYIYVFNGDGSIVMYLTQNTVLSAKYEKKTYPIRIKDKALQVKKPNASGYYSIGEDAIYEYQSGLSFLIVANNINAGKKITAINIENADGELLESIAVQWLESDYTYSTYNYQSNGAYSCELHVSLTVEDILYQIEYVVYSAMDELQQMTPTTEHYSVTANGSTPYTIKFQQTIKLIGEDEIKSVLEEQEGIETDKVMFSGWYSFLNSSSTEGTGYIQNNEYCDRKDYMHNDAAGGVTFYGYLINIFSYNLKGTSYSVELNNVISDTSSYKMHLAMNYETLSLPNVYQDAEVTEIGDFANLTGISTITIPQNVKTISANAFSGCTSLETVVYNQKLAIIEDNAFNGCTALGNSATTELPTSLTTIGNNAFYGCSAVTEVTVPYGVTTLGEQAFGEIASLRTINYNSKITASTGSLGNAPFFNSGYSADEGITLNVGADVTYIHAKLFNSNENVLNGKYLTTVRFVDSITKCEIGASAFKSSGVADIEFTSRVKSVLSEAFADCSSLSEVDLSETEIVSIYESSFRRSALTEIILPSTVVTIGNYAFAGCASLISVYYTQNGNNAYALESIGVGSFRKEDNNVNTAIERFIDVNNRAEAVENENAHKSVIIPNSIKTIGEKAFYGCNDIKDLQINGNTVNIGKNAFAGMAMLESIVYNVNNAANMTIEYPVFENSGKTGITLEFGTRVKKIPAYMFYSMGYVTDIDIPEQVEEIGQSAFGNMNMLTNITYRAAVVGDMTANASAFYGAGNSVAAGITLVVANTAEGIPAYLFNGATNIKNITFELTDTAEFTIGKNAFYGISAQDITFPKVKTLRIKENAFSTSTITSFNVNDGTENIVLEKSALNGIRNSNAMSLRLFGKTMNGIWGKIETGKLTATKTDGGGYSATMNGTLKSTSDAFCVGENDVLSFGASSVFEVFSTVEIIGGLIDEEGSEINVNDGNKLYGTALTAADLVEKNGKTYYTAIKIAEDISLSEAVTISRDEFVVVEGKTITFSGTTTIDVDNLTLFGGIIDNGRMTISYTASSDKGGGITAGTSNVVLSINDKVYVDNIDLSAISITSGTATLVPIGNGIQFILNENAIAQADEALTYGIYDSTVIEGTFTNKKAMDIIHLTLETSGTIVVENTLTLLVETAGGYPIIKGTIDAEAVKEEKQGINTVSHKYYKTIVSAIANTEIASVITIIKDVTQNFTLGIGTIQEIDFAGHKLTVNGTANKGISVTNSVTIKNMSLEIASTATESVALYVCENANLTVIGNSGTITNSGANGIGITNEGILQLSGMGIVADNGTGILNKGNCELEETEINANTGIDHSMIIDGSAGDTVLTDVTIEASNYGIRYLSTGTVSGSNVTITADYGIYSDIDMTLNTEGNLVLSDTSVVNGTTAGIYILGGGAVILKATSVTSTSAGYGTLGTLKAAIVLKDLISNGTHATLSTDKDVSISNDNGAALIYDNRAGAEGKNDIQIANASINGIVGQIVSIKTKNDLGVVDDVFVFENISERIVYEKTSLSRLLTPTTENGTYLCEDILENISAAIDRTDISTEKFVLLKNGFALTSSIGSGKLVYSIGTNNYSATSLNGELRIIKDGYVNFDSDVTVNGTIYLGGGNTINILKNITVTVNGKIKTEDANINNSGTLSFASSAEFISLAEGDSLMGKLTNNGTFNAACTISLRELINKAESAAHLGAVNISSIENIGELTMGSVTAYEITNQGTLDMNSATVSVITNKGTLTMKGTIIKLTNDSGATLTFTGDSEIKNEIISNKGTINATSALILNYTKAGMYSVDGDFIIGSMGQVSFVLLASVAASVPPGEEIKLYGLEIKKHMAIANGGSIDLRGSDLSLAKGAVVENLYNGMSKYNKIVLGECGAYLCNSNTGISFYGDKNQLISAIVVNVYDSTDIHTIKGYAHYNHIHKMTTEPPTCTQDGYNYCSEILHIETLEKYTADYDHSDEHTPSGVAALGHKFDTPGEIGSATHVCSRCNAEEAHTHSGLNTYGVNGVNALYYTCSVCNGSGEYVMFDTDANNAMTTAQATATLNGLLFNYNGNTYSVAVGDNSSTTLVSSLSNKTFVYNSCSYRVCQVALTLVSGTVTQPTSLFYVLVKHTCDNVKNYVDDTNHTACSLCGKTELHTFSTDTSTVITVTDGNLNSYNVLARICVECNGNGRYVADKSQSVNTVNNAINALKYTVNGITYTAKLTSTSYYTRLTSAYAGSTIVLDLMTYYLCEIRFTDASNNTLEGTYYLLAK